MGGTGTSRDVPNVSAEGGRTTEDVRFWWNKSGFEAHLSLGGLQLEVLPPAHPQLTPLRAHFHPSGGLHGQGPGRGLQPDQTTAAELRRSRRRLILMKRKRRRGGSGTNSELFWRRTVAGSPTPTFTTSEANGISTWPWKRLLHTIADEWEPISWGFVFRSVSN